jgi:7-cyano-7-deazaguanine synthase
MSIILLSGGLDSLVMLAAEPRAGTECITFRYGQRHRREIDHAARIAAAYSVPHTVIDITGAIPPCPLLGHGTIPAGARHDDPVQLATVVPNRNAVMISVASAWASARGHSRVLIGCHASDHAVYMDCRPNFIMDIDRAMAAGCGVRVVAPFVHKTRREVIELGRAAGVDFSLAWSCYEGGDEPCGACGACVERREAGA